MSDFLGSLGARALGVSVPAILPRLPSRFEPEPGTTEHFTPIERESAFPAGIREGEDGAFSDATPKYPFFSPRDMESAAPESTFVPAEGTGSGQKLDRPSELHATLSPGWEKEREPGVSRDANQVPFSSEFQESNQQLAPNEKTGTAAPETSPRSSGQQFVRQHLEAREDDTSRKLEERSERAERRGVAGNARDDISLSNTNTTSSKLSEIWTDTVDPTDRFSGRISSNGIKKTRIFEGSGEAERFETEPPSEDAVAGPDRSEKRYRAQDVHAVVDATDQPENSFRDKTNAAKSGLPDIHISIGRIEVRAVTAPPPPRPRRTPREPTLSLDEYLRKRNGGIG